MGHRDELTDEARFFLEPEQALHRQYEALRAYFVEGRPSALVAQAYGYTPGSFRVLCHEFRRDFERSGRFFKEPRRGPAKAPKRDLVRQQVVALRRRNLSVYDIQRELADKGQHISVNALSVLLKEEGFTPLKRRKQKERARHLAPERAPVADMRRLDLSPRRLPSSVAGLFLFMPLVAEIDLDALAAATGLPGSRMIGAAQALRTLLALKLLGKARHSQVMNLVFDPGIALFAGLNAVPKRGFLAGYGDRIDPRANLALLSHFAEATEKAGLLRGDSFDLDFHPVPAAAEVEPLDRHYLSRRSRAEKAILTFLARDAEHNVLLYGQAGLGKDERAGEVLRFAQYMKEHSGDYPKELVFDSQLTTYANLGKLQELSIAFITLRRRTKKLLAGIYGAPKHHWQRVTLPNLARRYRHPKVLEEQVYLRGYPGPLRQLSILDLGHEQPTILVTNQWRPKAATLITRYAQRMLIENSLAETIEFFHLDALSSVVGLKVDFDLQLTLMASSLYRMMAQRVDREYRRKKAATLFQQLFDVSGEIVISESHITVNFARRAHNPVLVAAGFADLEVPIPWLGGKRLQLRFP